MSTMQFQCKLLTDVILNVKSASEGPNTTLDFIPGSSFLGIVASEYDKFGDSAWDIFHSGKVKFGDAHPMLNGARTLRAAASFFHPKLDDSLFYNFHIGTPDGQLKQCRTDFYDYRILPPKKVVMERRFAIKSAYDSNLRRSKDEQMFGYESLVKGETFVFEVHSDDDALLNIIEETLVGIKHIGRSKSAQYGLVQIDRANYEEVRSTDKPYKPGYYTVYADSRLIFMDGFGLPTCRPTAQDLGFEDGAIIIWEQSQLRTFKYAPYNWKRKCFDTDRYGIEKGAVFVIKASASPSQSTYIGCYNNEGFGKVIYNPPFLTQGEYTLLGEEQPTAPNRTQSYQEEEVGDTALIVTLKRRNNHELTMKQIYGIVNEWIANNHKAFAGDRMASQWGEIRVISAKCGINEADVKKQVESYISHGVAKSLWEQKTRGKLLLGFIESCRKDKLLEGREWLAVSCLASEMAKIINPK